MFYIINIKVDMFWAPYLQDQSLYLDNAGEEYEGLKVVSTCIFERVTNFANC